VPAESFTKRTIQVYKDTPDKIDYLQPHYPFVEDPELRFTKFE
jgi:hypothetical protein